MGNRIETIKRRLKRKHAWKPNYLDGLVDNTTRIIMNQLANKGPRAQCEFLLEHGVTVDEIVKHGKEVSHYIRKHAKELNLNARRRHSKRYR